MGRTRPHSSSEQIYLNSIKENWLRVSLKNEISMIMVVAIIVA